MRTGGVRTLLITGGAGFIGSHFTTLWRRHFPYDKLVVLDKLTYAGNLQNLATVANSPNFHFYHGDICDPVVLSHIFTTHQPDMVVNFAAETHVDRSIHDANCFVHTNILGTQCMLEAALNFWRQRPDKTFRFHHISTDEVFGSLSPGDAESVEESPYRPNSPYSASKAAADHLVRAYRQTYGLPTTLTFCANNYGPQQYPEKLIPLAIGRILSGQPIPIYGTGQNIRDWLYVEDHCDALIKLLTADNSAVSYNIGGYEACTNLSLIHQLCQVMDGYFKDNKHILELYPDTPNAHGKTAESLITFVTDRPGHDERYGLNDTRLRIEYSWEPSTPLQEGLIKTVKAFIERDIDISYTLQAVAR